jgi:SAM-dependent methyltransferase
MTSAAEPYTGAENLEVMREAVNYNAWLLNLIRNRAPREGRILDFGAGAGTFARPLHTFGLNVTCLEPDLALGAMLRGQGLQVASAIEQLPDDSFDFIYTLNVLEHIDDDVGALRGLHAKLLKGGRLLIYVPAFQVLYGAMDRQVGHVRRYRRRDLAKRVTNAGFTVESSEYADSVGFFAALAFRFFRRSSGNLNPAHVRIYDRLIFPCSLLLDRVSWPFFGKNVTVVARRS